MGLTVEVTVSTQVITSFAKDYGYPEILLCWQPQSIYQRGVISSIVIACSIHSIPIL